MPLSSLLVLQAIWALSADGELRSTGDRTAIDYVARFDEYLEILTAGLRENSESIENVFREWDRILFPHYGATSARFSTTRRLKYGLQPICG